MSHMHRLLCSALLLFLLCCAYGCAAAAVVQPLPQKGQGAMDAYTVSVENTKKEGNWEPIRIRVIPRAVYLWRNLCTNDRRYGPLLGYYGTVNFDKDAFCDSKYGITEEKAKMIHAVTFKAAKLHMDRLRVQRVKGNLSLDNNGGKDFKQLCSDALAHPDHLALGVENADFALYVSLTRSREHPRICTKNYQKRPTSALIKVNPRDLKHTRYYIRLAAHDIGHGLGFYFPEFNEHKLLKETTLQTGRVIKYLHSDILKKKGEEHFDCQSMDGVELEGRDEGYFFEDYKFHPHWKRRYAKDELMSTDLNRPSGMYYTVLTLAAFHSLPFYEADFSKAETMSWGRKAGCGFVKGKCIEHSVNKYPNMFCVDEIKNLRCTTDRTALGKCSLKSLDWDMILTEFHYFSGFPRGSPYSDWMDHCPVIEPTFETSCELGKEDEMPGSLVSNTSRCLDVKALELRKGGKSDVEGICAKVKCEDGILKVQYKGNDDWHNCSDDDVIDNLNGEVFAGGKIVCPNYADFCRGPRKVSSPPLSTP